MSNIPTSQNNPGDLKQNGQIATFSNPAQGQAALYNDLTAKMTGTSSTGINGKSTLYDFAKVYAPDSDGNNSAQYAANLANQLKVSPDTPIGTLIPRIDDFAKAVSTNEGYQPQSSSNTQSPQPTQPTSQPGPVQSVIQSAASPFLKIGSSIRSGADLVGSITGQVLGNQSMENSANADYNKGQSQGYDYGYFGKNKPMNGVGDALATGAQAGVEVGGVIGAGALGASALGLMGGATSGAAEGIALGSEAIQSILTSDLGPGEELASQSAADIQNTLYSSLQDADAGEKPLIQQAMKENIANILKDAGVDSPSQLTQQVAQKAGIASNIWKFMKFLGWVGTGVQVENYVSNKAKGLIQGVITKATQSGQPSQQSSQSMYPTATYSP